VAADAPPHHFNDGIMDPSLMVMMRPSYATPLFDSQVRVLDHAAGVLACSGLTPIPISRAGIRVRDGKRARS
jgi:hypothetical protein